MLADRAAQPVRVPDGRDHGVAAVLEQPRQPVAQQRLVLRDHDPHGSSATTSVPVAGRARDRHVPAQRGDAVGDARQPGARRRHRAADAVVPDAHDEAAVAARGGDVDRRRASVLGGVRERLAGHEVGRGLDPVLEALGGDVDARLELRARRQLAQRVAQPVVEAGRAHAAGELAQLLDRARDLGHDGVDRRRVRQPVLQVAQGQADRHEPLLGAVVDVALEPAPLLVAGGDDAGARRLDLRELAADLDAQARDLDRQPRRADRAVEQVGTLGQRRIVDDRREREAAAAHGRAHPPGGIRALDHAARRVDLDVAVEAEAQLEPGIAERLREHGAGRLGRRAPRAQLFEEVLDRPQARVAVAVEAAVDEQLHPRPQRPNSSGDGERRRRRGHRRAGADRDPDRERDRREDGRQRRAQRDVDQRPVDQPVDLVEPVAQDRDAHRGRHRRQRHDPRPPA